MREYLGARGARFAIFPGSGLARKNPAVPDGRRARRDLAALGAAERRDQARVGRDDRRPPGEAHLLRAALVQEARGGAGPRTRHVVRRPARRRPARAVRRHRPCRRPRALHPARARPGGVAGRAAGTASTRRTRRCSRRRRSSSTGPGDATSSSTSTRSSTSTTPASVTTWSAARTSTPGGSASGRSGRSCSPSTRAMLTHDAADAGARARLPDPLAKDGRRVRGDGRTAASTSATTSSRGRPTTASRSTSPSRPSTGSRPTTSPGTCPGCARSW